MSSDEEDFNDIYGDDKPTTTEEVKKKKNKIRLAVVPRN